MYFMLKCDFLRSQRDYIAELFAKAVLHTSVHDKSHPKRELNAFRLRPKKFDFSGVDGYDSLRYEGMKVVKKSGGKKPDVFSWRYGDDDFYTHAEDDKCIGEELASMIDIQELYLAITLQVGPLPAQQALEGFPDERPVRTFDVTVRKNGDWLSQPAPMDDEVRKIDAVLEIMGLQDISGQKRLQKTTRK